MKTLLSIENACCDGCKKSIEKHTQGIPGLQSLVYTIASKTAELEHDESLDVNEVITKIGTIGKGNYKAKVA